MRRLVRAAGIVTVSAATIWGGAVYSASASASAPTEQVPGTAAGFASVLPVAGTPSGAQRLTVQVWLRQNTAGAAAYANAVSTPGSSMFRHYLTPREYETRFGASGATVKSVESWLSGAGFTGVTTQLNGKPETEYVRATAPVSTIDRAFRTTMRLYRPTAAVHASGGRQLEANDRAVSLPASIAGQVLGVTGLNNAAPLRTLDSAGASPSSSGPPPGCSSYFGQHMFPGLPKMWGRTSFSTLICGYSAAQIRAAYHAPASSEGTGEKVALIEVGLGTEMFPSLQKYASVNHLAAPARSRYSELPLGAASCGQDPGWTEEEALDVEADYVMAPKASQLVVGGDNCDYNDGGLQALFDADLAVINGNKSAPLATIASNSWENNGAGEGQPPAYTAIEHAYLVQAATEGVGMYFAAGDSSGVVMPSDDPYAISVGGTSLGLGAKNQRLFETGWSTGWTEINVVNHEWYQPPVEWAASGGGPSQLYAEPAWQFKVVPVALTKPHAGNLSRVRSVPDIGALGDPFTGFEIGLLESGSYLQGDIGGTSLATPLVAGLVADAQQGQTKPFGFVSPVLYSLAGTSAFNDNQPMTSATPSLYRGVACYQAYCGSGTSMLAIFDDQSPTMSGYTGQVTLRGYDNMTGLGTPNGPAFISALRRTK